MADTVTDTLTATIRSSVTWNRTETQEIGTIAQRGNRLATYALADGADAGEADLVFTDMRTIPAGNAEELDLLNLTQQTLEVSVPYQFRQVRYLRIVNNETASGRRLLVGSDPAKPTVVYAAEVGPASEFAAVNQTDSWRVTEVNSKFRVANPTSSSISYSLYVIGTSVAAGGSGGS